MNKSEIPLTFYTWDNKEHDAIKKTLKTNILTQNKTVLELEKKMGIK